MPAPCSSREVILAQKGIIEIDGEYLDIEKEIGIIDWSKVPVDTPVIVWGDDYEDSHKRYFAKYEESQIYAWPYGCTSWSGGEFKPVPYKHAKLADVNEE